MLLLLLFLLCLWFLLSGYLTFLPLIPGLIAIVVIVILYVRFMKTLKYKNSFRFNSFNFIFLYVPYLFKEIIVSNIAVAKLIISGKTSPKFVRVKNKLKTRFATSTFANSITLTPGTITMDINEKYLLIHILDSKNEASLHDSIMEKKIKTIEEK
ncbi:Na(+)/H(+) antiporter subunit E [Candidatus Hepatincola sp. Pdp]